ncbi:hypothetical protein [Streptomyces sp. B3I7]|nr:hypothetical protein [Streptomyces sp. B3I7]
MMSQARTHGNPGMVPAAQTDQPTISLHNTFTPNALKTTRGPAEVVTQAK